MPHVGSGLGAEGAGAQMMEAFFYDLRAALQEDLRGLHLEMIRELEAQRYEMRELLNEEQREVVSLREENERLRQQVQEMRGPMGGLAQWPGSDWTAAWSVGSTTDQ